MKTTHFLAGIAVLALGANFAPAQVHLNEIYASMTGTDTTEFYELIGPPGPLTGYMVLVVEGDWTTAGNQGTLKKAYDLSAQTIPASGYFVMGDNAVTPNNFPIGTSNAIENGSQTYYLVTTATPAAITALVNTHVDTPPGSKTTSIPTLATIIDIVAVWDNFSAALAPDTGFADTFYDGALVLGDDPNAPSFAPPGLLRCGNWPNEFSATVFPAFAPPLTSPAEALPTPGASNSGCTTTATARVFCVPGRFTTMACPCLNVPPAPGVGCGNTLGTGGALSPGGSATLSADTLTLFATGMDTGTACIFAQGTLGVGGGLPFGAGVRCAAGSLKRLYVKPVSGGAASAPDPGPPDPSITTVSAGLGDIIPPGGTRYYQTYYRDPTFSNPGPPCPANATFTMTTGLMATWVP